MLRRILWALAQIAFALLSAVLLPVSALLVAPNGILGGLANFTVWGTILAVVTLFNEYPDFRKALSPLPASLSLPASAPDALRRSPDGPAPIWNVVRDVLRSPSFHFRLAGTAFITSVVTWAMVVIAIPWRGEPEVVPYLLSLVVQIAAMPAFIVSGYVLSARNKSRAAERNEERH